MGTFLYPGVIAMSVYAEKRGGKPTGRWVVSVMRQGKREVLTYRTIEEAREVDSKLKAGLEIAQAVPQQVKTLEWLVAQSPLIWQGKARSNALASRRLEIAAGLIGIDRPIASVGTSDLDDLKPKLYAMRGYNGKRIVDPKTVHRYLAAVSAALKWAVKRGHLASCPLIPWPKVFDAPKKFFSLEEEQAICSFLIQQQMPDKAVLVRVLSATGMRIGELLQLKPENIADGFVLVGNWDGGTKTNDWRYAPIPEPLAARLLDVMGRGLPTYPMMRRAMARAVRACGIDPKKTLHKLRHTTATRLNKAGVPIPTIKEYLGHRKITTTMLYTSVEPEDLKRASRVLADQIATVSNEGVSQAILAKPSRMDAQSNQRVIEQERIEDRGVISAPVHPIEALEKPRETEGPLADNPTDDPVDNPWISLVEKP